MIRRMFRRCGHAPGALTPEDQAVVDAFRAMLAAVRDPELWTPGRAQDVTVRVGPFIERAHTRPGDDHGTEMIAVALVHPDTPHAAAYLHGTSSATPTEAGCAARRARSSASGSRPTRCSATPPQACPSPTTSAWPPAHYGVHVEARRADNTGHTLLRLGPYTQTWLASHDADRLNTELEGKAATVIPGFTVTAKDASFDVSDHESYADPYEADVAALLADAVAGVSA